MERDQWSKAVEEEEQAVNLQQGQGEYVFALPVIMRLLMLEDSPAIKENALHAEAQ